MYRVLSYSLLFALFLSGCAHRVGEFTAISTMNVPVKTTAGTKASGSTCIERFLLNSISFGEKDMRSALEQALNEGHGELMLDARVYEYWYPIIPGLWVRDCMSVEGVVARIDGSSSGTMRTSQPDTGETTGGPAPDKNR